MDWPRILAYITGTVDQELLLRNEYLVAENRILRDQVNGRLLLSDSEKNDARRDWLPARSEGACGRGECGKAGYHPRLVQEAGGPEVRWFQARRRIGRPPVDGVIEQLIVRMARENPSWGYDRIVGALANLGHGVSDQTVGNVLRRHGLAPAPQRKRTTTWAAFIRTHLTVLAGTDFFSVEVFTLRGLVTYYVLFFIHLETRRVNIAGITVHPDERWMQQIARNNASVMASTRSVFARSATGSSAITRNSSWI